MDLISIITNNNYFLFIIIMLIMPINGIIIGLAKGYYKLIGVVLILTQILYLYKVSTVINWSLFK